MPGLSDLNNELSSVINRKMKFLPTYLEALSGCLLLALEGKFPALSKRRAISATIATLVLLLIIAFGAILVYAILSAPSTKPYP